MIAYTVAVNFPRAETALEWFAWLEKEHLADVLAGGAMDAEVIQFDGEPCRCEVRYHFDSRAAFAEYERIHAPGLRAEGLKRFPAERGISYARSLGEVLVRRD